MCIVVASEVQNQTTIQFMTNQSPIPDLNHLPDPDSIRSKGFTLTGALAFAEDRWGSAGKERLLGECDGEMGRLIRRRIPSSSWIPFSYQVALYEAIDRTFGRGDYELCRDIGRFTADYELSTVHRLFMKVARLDVWLKTAGFMWRFYYSEGRLDPVLESDHRRGDVSIREFHPISTAFCLDFAGWLERTVELAGAGPTRVEHGECLLDGADRCHFHAEW